MILFIDSLYFLYHSGAPRGSSLQEKSSEERSDNDSSHADKEESLINKQSPDKQCLSDNKISDNGAKNVLPVVVSDIDSKSSNLDQRVVIGERGEGEGQEANEDKLAPKHSIDIVSSKDRLTSNSPAGSISNKAIDDNYGVLQNER